MKGYIYIVLALSLFFFGCFNIGGLGNGSDNKTGVNQTGCVCATIYKPVCGVDSKTYSNVCTAGCAGVNVAYEGQCVPAVGCVDSDGGKNVSTKGTLRAGTNTYNDSCRDTDTVDEYYCDGSVISKEAIDCSSDQVCKDGACAKKALAPAPTCIDSDGGLDYFAQGAVNEGGTIYQDVCTGVQNVKEYYCQNDAVQNVVYQCPSGDRCENGRCTQADRSCSDTDGGDDIYQRGTLTVGTIVASSNYQDSCDDDDTVKEYYCVGDSYASHNVNCPTGYECSSGRCKEEQCDDSDGGNEIYTKGTTSKGSTSSDDYCTGVASGVEFYCSSDNIASSSFVCPSDYSCSNGRCTGNTCSDSDSGTDIYNYGSVTKGGSTYNDYCSGSHSVEEYYCSGNNVASGSYTCAYGYACSSGECVATCEDPDDGGKNAGVRGTTYEGSSAKTDSCVDDTTVDEWYCDSTDHIASTYISCGWGCSSGACLPSPL